MRKPSTITADQDQDGQSPAQSEERDMQKRISMRYVEQRRSHRVFLLKRSLVIGHLLLVTCYMVTGYTVQLLKLEQTAKSATTPITNNQ